MGFGYICDFLHNWNDDITTAYSSKWSFQLTNNHVAIISLLILQIYDKTINIQNSVWKWHCVFYKLWSTLDKSTIDLPRCGTSVAAPKEPTQQSNVNGRGRLDVICSLLHWQSHFCEEETYHSNKSNRKDTDLNLCVSSNNIIGIIQMLNILEG